MASRDRQDLIDEIVWGSKRGAFESDTGQSLLDVWRADELDTFDIEMIYELTHPLRMKARFGEEVPFLTPPATHGDFILGYLENGSAFTIPRNAAVQGLLISGSSGSGKSNLLSFHALQWAAMPEVSIWLSDMYKTQHRHLRPLFARCDKDLITLQASQWRFNPLQTDGRDPLGHAARITDILASRLGLPPRARTIVRKTIHELNAEYGILDGPRSESPCLHDVLLRVERTPGLNAPAREAILDRLGPLIESHPFYRNAWRRGWPASELAKHSIVFEMKDASEAAKQVMLETTLSSIFHDEIEKGIVNGPLSLVIAFEDSQRFFSEQSGGDHVTPTVIEQAGLIRGTGRALVGLVQTGIGLPKSLTANLSTRYMGRQSIAEDYSRFGGDMGLDREQIRWAMHHLQPGRFVVQVSEGQWRHPLLLSVPELKIRPLVTDDEANASVRALDHIPTIPAPEYAKWPGRPPEVRTDEEISNESSPRVPANEMPTAPERVGRAPQLPDALKKQDLDYLEAIAESPFESKTARDKRLGISTWKGNDMRARLEAAGFTRPVQINRGTRGGTLHLLEVTSEGEQLLKSFGVRIKKGRGRGGLAHQFWCASISDWATGLGLDPTVEDESSGARVDVVIRVEDQEPIAVEVELTPGHEVINVSKDLESGFSTVVSLIEDAARVDTVLAAVRDHIGTPDPGATEVLVVHLRDFRTVLGRLFEPPEAGRIVL